MLQSLDFMKSSSLRPSSECPQQSIAMDITERVISLPVDLDSDEAFRAETRFSEL